MDMTMPSGETVQLRTALKAKDKFAVQGVIRITDAGTISEGGGTLSLMETALLARLLEGWSLDAQLPSLHACPGCTGDSAKWHEHVREEFGEALDLDDYNYLEETIAPMLEKVMRAPNLKTSSASEASS